MLGHGIFRAARCAVCLAGILQDDVDFRHLEPGQFDLDVEIDQALQLNRQKLLVPPGLLGKLVVGQDVGSLRCESRTVGIAWMSRSLAASTRP